MNPGKQYEDFLFAPMGEDRNGLPLNVLSALARLNVDPWEEAAHLAGLPSDLATLKLTSLIAALPIGSSARADPGTTAHRLIALLRIQPGQKIRSPGATSGRDGPSRAATFVLYFLIAMAFMMVGQWIAGGRHTQAQMDTELAPVAVTVFPQTVLSQYAE